MPESGSPEFEDMIDFMRADLESDMSLSKMIHSVQKQMEKDGRDFNAEFEKFKKSQNN